MKARRVTKPRIRAHLAPFLRASDCGHLRLVNSLVLALERTRSATLLLGLEIKLYLLLFSASGRAICDCEAGGFALQNRSPVNRTKRVSDRGTRFSVAGELYY